MSNYQLIVNGSILAVGTENDSINFTSGRAIKSVTDWDGIRIDSNSDTTKTVIFQYCNLSYGGTENAMIFVDDCHGEGVLGGGKGIVSDRKSVV